MHRAYHFRLALGIAVVLLTVSLFASPGRAVGWAPIHGGPGAYGCALALDPVHDQLVSFGGSRSDGAYTSEVWVRPAAGGAWSKLLPSGTPPSARRNATMLFDPVTQRMLIAGGSPPYLGFLYSVEAEVHALTLGPSPSWSVAVPAANGPSFISGASIVLDPKRNRLIAFGGGGTVRLTSQYTNDTWVAALDGTPQWSGPLSLPVRPNGRADHSAWFDSTGDRLLIHAGSFMYSTLSDTWQLDLSGSPAWTMVPTSWRIAWLC